MCGIIAYTGKRLCKDTLLASLSRLEYRGYDSAGFVCIDSKTNRFSYLKEAGGIAPVKRLQEHVAFDGFTGMGHTRWATHGVVDTTNAHPHLNCHKTIAVIHNGIIEGHDQLREELLASGHTIVSTTDTELAVHLFTDELGDAAGDLKAATLSFVTKIRGAFSFIFLLEKYPGTILVIRHRSPMVIGIGDQESFIASDLIAFSDSVRNVVFMPDDSFALVKPDSLELYNFAGKPLAYSIQAVDPSYIDVDKGAFEHFMLKEIYEQKRAISRTLAFCKMLGNTQSSPQRFGLLQQPPLDYGDAIWRQLGLSKEQVLNLRYINLISAGTSWHAARIAQFFFEIICKIPTRVYLSSEFRYMPLFTEPHSVYLFISQSGETADTLEALRLVNATEMPTIAITNVASSSMVREATGFLPMQAGPEISVASTKSFTTQIATLYWLANRIALEQGIISAEDMYAAEEQLCIAAEVLESTIETYKFAITQKLAPAYALYDRFIFLGRHISYPFALEAGLKLKEVSYIFAQSYPAGELKHGPIALVDEKTPIFIFSLLDDLLYHKLLANAHEVKARGGLLTVFAFEGQQELIDIADTAFVIPRVAPLLAPLAMAGLMQFLVYQITRQLGKPIDRPRNLAKSVTVE